MSRSTPTSESCHEIEIVQKELWRMCRSEKDQSQKKKILDSIVTNAVKKTSMFEERSWWSDDENIEMEDLEEEIEKNL